MNPHIKGFPLDWGKGLGTGGFRHDIEEIPYRTSQRQVGEIITVEEGVKLPIGVNINRRKIQQALTQPQLEWVKKLDEILQTTERFTEDEVLDALHSEGGTKHIEYFYCHAGTRGDPHKDFDQSFLGLTRANQGLTLEDIRLTTLGRHFEGNPLFILNACESAQMDGQFYDGFVPQFLEMGACSVVGTDCKVPDIFGAHFGLLLLQGFFRGQSVGQALLSARRYFFEQYRNPLGLIYRAFGNMDAHLSRRVLEESPA